MGFPRYLSTEELKNILLSEEMGQRDKCCPGFIIPETFSIQRSAPIPWIHFHPKTKQPITLVCNHQTCQPFAEILFMLVRLFALAEIDLSEWRQLFPSRLLAWKRGLPRMATKDSLPLDRYCCGYLLSPTGKYKDQKRDRLEHGTDIDETTGEVFTQACPHNGKCVPETPFLYALYTLYATSKITGFSIFERNEDLDPKYILTHYSWVARLNEDSPDQIMEKFTNPAHWPAQLYSKRIADLLFSPTTLVDSVVKLPGNRSLVPETRGKKRVIIREEFSSGSESDENDCEYERGDVSFHLENHLAKIQNPLSKHKGVTAELLYGKNPKIVLKSTHQHSRVSSRTQCDCSRPATFKRLALELDVKEDVPGLIEFLGMCTAELKREELTRKVKRALSVASFDISNADENLFTHRRASQSKLRRQHREEIKKTRKSTPQEDEVYEETMDEEVAPTSSNWTVL